MAWILLAIFAAFFNALKNTLMKKVSGTFDAYTVALVSNVLMLPVLWGSVFISGEFVVDAAFWKQMLLMLPFEVLVTILFFKAIKDSELSSSFPFVAFMPLFVAIGSLVILDEAIGTALFIGLVFLSAGSFILNRVNMGLSSFVFRGALYMFLASAIWGYLIPMGRIAVEHSSAQLFPAIYFTLAQILFIPIYLQKRESKLSDLKNELFVFLGIGVTNGLFIVLNWMAYATGIVSGVAALGQLAILFTVLIGGTYFKEQKLSIKLVATVLMLIGAVSIVIAA